ncbi:DMT family transporter [Limnobacter litoralis]|uniref:Peptide ABC transporter ATP-binding protein n=1 Tax=Limnobacter litoralis TaxID=481366 RepID=A0ABQ5YP52_9BURK|nr:DMT family transporter [Limnobacter litoralis]GLR25696.1 peptide ABC transporter ATP-binding protein [Limnobacter litoralis]
MLNYYPLLFVFLWSTGFIGAKYGLPYAEPLTFLLLRYCAVIVLMSAFALLAKAKWETKPSQMFHLAVAGSLIHGCYLGGVFVAISLGLPAGVVSLIVGMQPLLTALLAPIVVGERMRPIQWLGLLLGLVGVALVLSQRIHSGFALHGLYWALGALLGITVGTLYQKRHCAHFDWRTGAVMQFIGAAVVTFPVALLIEHFHVQWTGHFLFALSWLVLVLSLGAVTLLNTLIRSGTAVNVASLFYLVPPATALIAWLMFHESFTLVQTLGLAVAVTGVAIARR